MTCTQVVNHDLFLFILHTRESPLIDRRMRCQSLLTPDLDGWVDEHSLITASVTQTQRPYAVDQFQYLGAVAVKFRSPHAVDSGQCLQAGWLSSRDGS